MSSTSRKHWVRLAAIPSTVFAAVVFSCGWLSVSPFASWPSWLLFALCGPAVVPFVLMVLELSRQQGGRRFRRTLTAPPLPSPKFRWRDVLTPRRAVFVGSLAVVVFVSFFSAFDDYRGTPEVIDGNLVFTDHGRVIGPATEREADEARTRVSRMFSGHLLLFGTIGLLVQLPSTTVPSRAGRPSSGRRVVRTRPGGPRRPPPGGDDT